MAKPAKNPVMVLQELTVKMCLAPPAYELINTMVGTHQNRFDYMVRVAGQIAEGTGPSKQVSKHATALNMLLKLQEIGLYDPKVDPVEGFRTNAIPISDSPMNFIGPLKDLCVENKIEDPVFTELSDVGPPHDRQFTYECKIGSLKTVATGKTKKMAKQLTAKDMLEKIKTVLPSIIVEAPRQECKTLPTSEVDEDILKLYNDICSIVVDKKTKVSDFCFGFKKLMIEKERTIDEFEEDFKEESEEALKRILQKLELNYTIYRHQENPLILTLMIPMDSTFVHMATGLTENAAKADLIHSTFQAMSMYMRL